MNASERALAVLNYQPYDKLPVVHFGYWWETLEKWYNEGHLPKQEGKYDGWTAWNAAGPMLGFDYEWSPVYGANMGLEPAFEETVIATFPDGSSHVRDRQGVTVLRAPGAVSIPAEIEHLLTDRASWEEHYKHRLQWSPQRIADNPACQENAPRGIYCGSLIGSIRDIVGVVGLAYMMVDDEELLDEIIQANADVCLKNVQAILATGKRFDYGHFWEDICFKNGPLVNPAFFEEKIGPHYKPITDELHEHGIEIVSLDCDGVIDDLIPTWIENGVNTMFPIEVGTWNANIKPWREKYGKELRGVGGMNKHAFAEDRAAVDAEIERMKPLIELGGFIPCPDHRIPPTAEWDLVRYYTDRMRALF